MAHVAERVFDSLPRSLKRMTFFEGLAGANADIDAVFEIEGEFDSALDITDNDPFSIQHQQHRRLSGASSRRGRPFPPASPPKAQRNRLYSILPQGQTASPLAQVFNPFLVEDDNMPEYMSGHSIPPGVSFGPATRRRLTSMAQPSQRRVTEPPVGNAGGVISHATRRFPVMSDKDSPPGNSVQRSRSHDHYQRKQPIPAGEIEDGEDSQGETGEQANVLRRLDAMDKRQKNIESLLMEISQNIHSSRT
ncbi:hypothetical protein NLJ89_g10992 [Agrocybe chaxingu]|uniref:Uncharacterized protein n=1 Tax=Agrocybe chaxingu TaxID=84603 RepID=A0A9W8MNE8_9AGAR|nr:hypothetical protein NLJ89_g10992 [Agrocybe chaxingu]